MNIEKYVKDFHRETNRQLIIGVTLSILMGFCVCVTVLYFLRQQDIQNGNLVSGKNGYYKCQLVSDL